MIEEIEMITLSEDSVDRDDIGGSHEHALTKSPVLRSRARKMETEIVGERKSEALRNDKYHVHMPSLGKENIHSFVITPPSDKLVSVKLTPRSVFRLNVHFTS